MSFLYHSIPNNIIGEKLIPLNQLKSTSPESYLLEAKKYTGRGNLLNRRIPKLNCLWNDVLHFTAVPPLDVYQALEDSGSELKKRNWFKIDPSLLDKERTVIWLYQNTDFKIDESALLEYNPSDLSKYSKLPERTLEYYKSSIAKGEIPLLFHFVPHILYKGTLDINKLTRMELA